MTKSRAGKKNPNYSTGRYGEPSFNLKLDPGLREKMEAAGVKNKTAFINEAVSEKLERQTAVKETDKMTKKPATYEGLLEALDNANDDFTCSFWQGNTFITERYVRYWEGDNFGIKSYRSAAPHAPSSRIVTARDY